MQTLRGQLGGMLPVMPYGSKEARASAVASLIAAGDVYLPHPMLYAWVQGLQTHLAAFPAADTDEIDTLTQYLQYAHAQVQAGQKTRKAAATLGPGDVLDETGNFY